MSENISTPEEPETNSGRTVAITAAYILVSALLCVGSLAAAGFGVYSVALTSPIVLRVGSFALSVEVTTNPECSTMMRGCPAGFPAHGSNYLTVWRATISTNTKTVQRVFKLQVP